MLCVNSSSSVCFYNFVVEPVGCHILTPNDKNESLFYERFIKISNLNSYVTYVYTGIHLVFTMYSTS